MLLLACGGVPTATLLLARPRTQADERGAMLLALTVAAIIVAPLFTPIL